MLIQHLASGSLAELDDVLAKEFIAEGIAKPVQRRTALFAGPAVGEVEDPEQVVVQVPADTTDVDPRSS